MSPLNLDDGRIDQGETNSESRQTRNEERKQRLIMAYKPALVVVLLLESAVAALAAEPYGATVAGKPVTSVQRPATKDLTLGGGLSRNELVEAAHSGRPARLAPSNFAPTGLGGGAAPGK